MIEICFGAIATVTAVYMTHLQSSWVHGRSLPHCLIRFIGNIKVEYKSSVSPDSSIKNESISNDVVSIFSFSFIQISFLAIGKMSSRYRTNIETNRNRYWSRWIVQTVDDCMRKNRSISVNRISHCKYVRIYAHAIHRLLLSVNKSISIIVIYTLFQIFCNYQCSIFT